VTAAVALVLAIAATGMWLGLPRGGAQPGAQPPASPEPSASPVEASPSLGEASASPLATWGPLAVVPSSNGDQARTEGTLRITDTCVFVDLGGTPTLLLWGADRTAWSVESRTVTFDNFDGTVVTVADGDDVVLGGSGGGRASEAESGISNEGWVSRTEWVSPPAPSCPLDEWWGVGSVEVSAAPTAPVSASPAEPSPSPAAPSPSLVDAWGPLAVVPPQDGMDTARNEGRLRITDTCVFMEVGGTPTLLIWPADRTTWSAETQSITFENFDGTTVTVADGDDVVVGGSGGGRSSEAESGISNEGWVGRREWVVPPAASCPLDEHWSVGSLASPAITCGRIDEAQCMEAVDAARQLAPDAFPAGSQTVVDSECGPGQFCSFNAGTIVVVVDPSRPEPTGQAFVLRWGSDAFETPYDDLPAHVFELFPGLPEPA